jgi:two-component system, OmpR family, phosphate regulon response regulator PhoB
VSKRTELLADEYIELDLAAHRASALGRQVELTPIEFRLLETFLRQPGRALSHSQLLAAVWGPRYGSKAEVKLYVHYLRRKLHAAASLEPLTTVRGVGYRYEPRLLP